VWTVSDKINVVESVDKAESQAKMSSDIGIFESTLRGFVY